MMKKLLSALFALFLLASFIPAYAEEHEGKILLALGDSISAGYGLSSPETETFVYGIQSSEKVVNKAINGNTADGVWEQLQNPQSEMHVDESLIKSATVVTITCGGNDLMAILYEKMADNWNKNNPSKTITANEVPIKMASGDIGFIMSGIKILDSGSKEYLINDPDFSLALDKYTETLKKITSYINMINPMCAVIVATQYNPYAEFKTSLFSVVYKGIEDGVNKLNDSIIETSSEGGYMVAPVKERFESYSEGGDLYNADISSMNLDFHPTAEGHKVLRLVFADTISTIQYVNYTVSHYYEAFDGAIDVKETHLKAVSGVNITAVQESADGFSYASGHPQEIKTLRAEEGVGLKLFYSRNIYSIEWNINGDITKKELKYGEKISPIQGEKKGYKFLGWDKSIPETMPAENLSFKAVLEKDNKMMIFAITGVVAVCVIAGFIVVWTGKKKKQHQMHKAL